MNHLLMLSVRAPLEKCSFRTFLSFSSLYNLSRTVCFFLLNPRLTTLTVCVSVLPSFRSFSKIFHIKLKSRTFISLDDVAPLLRWYFHLLSVEFLLISFFVCLCECVCVCLSPRMWQYVKVSRWLNLFMIKNSMPSEGTHTLRGSNASFSFCILAHCSKSTRSQL